jgi:hypothetical protein
MGVRAGCQRGLNDRRDVIYIRPFHVVVAALLLATVGLGAWLLFGGTTHESAGAPVTVTRTVTVTQTQTVAVTVPADSGTSDDPAAAADLRSIIPSVEAYFSDHGTYAGITIAGLTELYDKSIDPSLYRLGHGTQGAASYCVQATAGSETWYKAGPDSSIAPGACP